MRRRAQPRRGPRAQRPLITAEEDGRVLAGRAAIVAADADERPWTASGDGGRDVGGVGDVEAGEDIDELAVQDFLQANERCRALARMVEELGDEGCLAVRPEQFAGEGGSRGVADVVGQDADGEGRGVGRCGTHVDDQEMTI